ncbi:hypothetical protein FPQ18DRAFT_314529 [Pyronema domesticum]|nr:hypothetical protein FPQ18DRAFT_314529 [Pyronema domesticum]
MVRVLRFRILFWVIKMLMLMRWCWSLGVCLTFPFCVYHTMRWGRSLDVGLYIDLKVWGFDSFLVSTLLLYYYLDLMGNLIMEEYEWMEMLLLIPFNWLTLSLLTT